MQEIISYFEEISDPRIDRSKKHDLLDIIMISLCAVLAGADGWEAIYDFALVREDWLKSFLKLNSGIPSADTIRRVISRISPKEFEKSFTLWVSDIRTKIKGVISIDGKTVKNKKMESPLHLVSAWSNQNQGICLGQVATETKSNEIRAIPCLLDILDIAGCLITIDAIGCQKKIAKKIINSKADYCLAVKNNHPRLYKQIESFFSDANRSIIGNVKQTVQKNKGHGRQEVRVAYLSKISPEVPKLSEWPSVKQFGMILSKRTVNRKTSIQKRYFITSSSMSAKNFITATRSHWGIENQLHWVLDVVFKEDGNRILKDHGQQNLSVLRRLSINLLNQDDSKLSKKRRMFRMAMDPSYMKKVLGYL